VTSQRKRGRGARTGHTRHRISFEQIRKNCAYGCDCLLRGRNCCIAARHRRQLDVDACVRDWYGRDVRHLFRSRSQARRAGFASAGNGRTRPRAASCRGICARRVRTCARGGRHRIKRISSRVPLRCPHRYCRSRLRVPDQTTRVINACAMRKPARRRLPRSCSTPSISGAVTMPQPRRTPFLRRYAEEPYFCAAR